MPVYFSVTAAAQTEDIPLKKNYFVDDISLDSFLYISELIISDGN